MSVAHFSLILSLERIRCWTRKGIIFFIDNLKINSQRNLAFRILGFKVWLGVILL